tara:strand:- start:160072 stop:160686 length:615 start_codon:yes stop_codon:yes gene_type:complete
MKKLTPVLILLFSFLVSHAQLNVKYGLKAGMNYSSFGDLTFIGGFAGSINTKAESEMGYAFGVITEINVDKFSLISELLFQQSKSSYNNFQYKVSSLELPLLTGYSIIKPLTVYIGPSIKYIVDDALEGLFNSDDFGVDKKTLLKANIGISTQLNKFKVDLRYSFDLSNTNASYYPIQPHFIGQGYQLDASSQQFTLSLSYFIN